MRENPFREVATKDHSSSNLPKGNPPDLKTKEDVSKVEGTGFPIVAHQTAIGDTKAATPPPNAQCPAEESLSCDTPSRSQYGVFTSDVPVRVIGITTASDLNR